MLKMRNRIGILFAALLLIVAGGLAACGGSGDGGDSPRKATLVLDYLPNGIHAGIYRARAAGYYEQAGIDLEIVTPTSTADTLRLIQSGKADFGLADGIDIAEQVAAGRDARALAALLQRPAGGLITRASSGVESPADLEGRTAGVTGMPSDRAVLDTMVEDDGGDPDKVKVVTLGFNGPQAVISNRVAAFTGYIPADAAAIISQGVTANTFPFDSFGGPSYPGLVFFSTGERIDQDPALMLGFVSATMRGYRETFADPERAIDDLVAATEGIDRELALATLEACRPLIGKTENLGRIRPGAIRQLSDFLEENDLIDRPVTPEQFGRSLAGN